MSSGTEGRGNDDAWRDRYLLCNYLVDPALASKRKRFEALSRFVRDLLAHRWVKTRRAREAANPKRVYYLSMEFLIGRTLNNNILNLAAEPLVPGRAWPARAGTCRTCVEKEPDAGLGNGGLGRLAACFIDSLATLQYSAIGYGLRYEYGIFRQSIRNGYQVEQPDNWLRQPDPWEIRAPASVTRSRSTRASSSKARRSASSRTGRPRCSASPTTGRWSGTARAASTRCGSGRPRRPSSFDFAEFSHGDFVGRGHPERARGVAHARALPGRLDRGRPDAALPPAVLPRELLAAGHRRALPAGGRSGLVRPAGPRRDPAERHASRALGRRADAHPARRGARSAGTRPGT